MMLILVLLVSFAAMAGESTVLVEGWNTGVIDETVWKPFGYPSAVLYQGEGLLDSWGLDCNGDNWYGSGLCTYTDYDLSALPWVSFWYRGNGTFTDWQDTRVLFSKASSFYWGGNEAQPQRLATVQLVPATDLSYVRFTYHAPDSNEIYSEDWNDSLFNDVWMSYQFRINPRGTFSYLRSDTLRYETTGMINPNEWTAQTFVLEGMSYNHHQLLDDILLTFPGLHDNWEEGVVPSRWDSRGPSQYLEEAGEGIYGSDGVSPGETGVSGLASWQVFDLSTRPFIFFSLKASASSSGWIEAGWSQCDEPGYRNESTDLAVSVHVNPFLSLIEYRLPGETLSEQWMPWMDQQWQQFTLRINRDSTVSFFRNDTLRFTSSFSIAPSLHSSQSLVFQGQGAGGLPVLDEVFVYPSMSVPQNFLIPLNSVCTWNGSHGWAAGEGGRLLETSNFGAAWEAVDIDPNLNLNDIDFTSNEHGWAAADNGKVLITLDGEEWFTKETGYTENLTAVSFADDLNGWVMGEDLLLRTTNAGFNWSEQFHPLAGLPGDVAAVGENSAFIVGEAGEMAFTDNGVTWQTIQPVTSSDLYAVDFFDPLHGWAVGAGGTILATFNAGETWTVQNSGVTGDLTAVSFFDGEHGFAVGSGGCVLETADGGLTWNGITVPGYGDCSFTGVAAYSETAAWAVCELGTVLLGDYYSGVEDRGCSPPGLELRPLVNPVLPGGGLSLEVNSFQGAVASIMVYDTSGRLVAFRNGLQINRGTTGVSIDLDDDLPGGVYLVQCEAMSSRGTCSFVLLKNR